MIISQTKLLNLMNHSKISIQDLAVGINVNYSTVNRIVNGETSSPRVETIYSIANFFGVDPSMICEGLATDNIVTDHGAMTFNNIKDLLTFLVNKTGIKSTTLLNRASGIPKSTLDKLLSGETVTPNLQTIQKLSEYFNLTVDQINGKSPILASTLQEIHLSKRLLPIIDFTSINEWVYGDYNSVKVTNYVHSTLLVGNLSFAIKIPNDSYEPDFLMNSMLIIDTQAEITQGSYVIAQENSTNIIDIFEVMHHNSEYKLRRSGIHNGEDGNLNLYKIIGVAVQEVRNLK